MHHHCVNSRTLPALALALTDLSDPLINRVSSDYSVGSSTRIPKEKRVKRCFYNMWLLSSSESLL